MLSLEKEDSEIKISLLQVIAIQMTLDKHFMLYRERLMFLV